MRVTRFTICLRSFIAAGLLFCGSPAHAQSGPAACSVALDKSAFTVGSAEANWNINVTAAGTCAWTAASDSPWIVVKSTVPATSIGNGYAKIRAITNTVSPSKRTGRVTINGSIYTVTQGGCGTACTATAPPAPPPPLLPPPPPPPPPTATLRVLHWNTHHGGVGTDGKWDPNRLMTWVAAINPDVASFNEVEMYGTGNADDPVLFASLLKQKTGVTWYYHFTTGNGAARGIGNLVMSRFPLDAKSTQLLSDDRAVANVTITFNGRTINVSSTHLDDASTTMRQIEIGELTTWERSFAEQRIICGDFNASPTSVEHAKLKSDYTDTWEKAQAAGTAIAYAGNTAGNTRNTRIDYIYSSNNAGLLVLQSSQVFDTRDANGVMPSDHRPLLSIFTVK